MFWSETAQKAMYIAKFFAKRSQYTTVNSGHVLAALHNVDYVGLFGGLLDELGIYAKKVLENIDQTNFPKNCNVDQSWDLSWTLGAVQVTKIAPQKAAMLNHPTVSTGHLLLAICDSRMADLQGVPGDVPDEHTLLAAEIIGQLGASTYKVEKQTLKIFDIKGKILKKVNSCILDL